MKYGNPVLAFAAVCWLTAIFSAHAGEALKRPVVVELYTSQGCSSCPPADALLGLLAGRAGILAMSLPVTYWDMLGWKDTLASDANTRRQKAYAETMGHGGLYTPEMIVDGITDVVGSRTANVKAAIAARQADMVSVPVSLTSSRGDVHVTVAGDPSLTGKDGQSIEATIWAFQLLKQATVKIGGGENGGRKLTYRNIVRSLRAVGIWKGQPVSLDLPRHALSDPPHDALAIVVQEDGYGRVIGAALLGKADYSPPR